MIRRLAGFLVSVFLIAGGVWAVLHHQLLVDRYVAATYAPSPELRVLTNQVKLTDHAEFLVRATQASLDDRNAFNTHCAKKDSGSITLGCYVGPQHLYVYNVTEGRLEGVRQVTLAHEMLHAAYDRLSSNERTQINRELEAALPSVLRTYPELSKRLAVYEKTEPGERNNELHSILGTEVASLSETLENHYRQYFENRQVVVDYASRYAKLFQDLKDNQDRIVAELEGLSKQINQEVDSYNNDIQALDSKIGVFNARASQTGGFSSQAEFDTERNVLQAEKDRLDIRRDSINKKVQEYQQKRSQLEALNVEVQDLNTQLDSTKLPAL